MSVIDYALIVIVTVSVLIGCLRGFVREAISLAAWAVAIWVALRYASLVEPWLGALDQSPSLKLWTARAILFVAALLAGAMVNYLLGLLVRSTGLSGTDRLLGMLFGFGRGVLVVGVLVIGGQYAGMSADPWWQQSRLMPWGERLADGIRDFAEEAGDRIKDIAPLGRGAGTTASTG